MIDIDELARHTADQIADLIAVKAPWSQVTELIADAIDKALESATGE